MKLSTLTTGFPMPTPARRTQREWLLAAGGVGLSVADGGPQPAQRSAQVVSRAGIGVFRPQQPGQRIAAVGHAGMQRQVGQQRAGRVRAKLRYGLAIQRDLKGAEKADLPARCH